MQYTIKNASTIFLGKQGEHLARELVFPVVAEWETEFGPGTADILYLPSGAKEPCSIVLERTEEGAGLWTVTAANVVNAGYGRCELRYLTEEVVAKSVSYATYVAESLGEVEEVNGAVAAHAASHASKGTDPIAPGDIGAASVADMTAALAGKQDVITGAPGQMVGFDAEGKPEAQDAPQAGMTQAEADGRYLTLTGGTVTGTLVVQEPTESNHAAHKGYVDQAIRAAVSDSWAASY